MRAVNLMPESGRGAAASPTALLNPAYGLVAVLAVALGLVTMYVLSSNTVSSRQAQLATVQQEAQQAQAQATQLTSYVNYQKLAQQRISTVQQIVSGRFDWDGAMSNLAHVVPPNTVFESLLATASPATSVSGAGGSVGGGAGTSGLRSDISAPAFEVKGCSISHDAVARLISRLRAMPDVQRVTLADSVRSQIESSGGGSGSASNVAAPACGRNPANFDLVVFFEPLAGATGAAGAPGAAPVTSPAGAATTASSATTTTPPRRRLPRPAARRAPSR